jgi:hypothetical protein
LTRLPAWLRPKASRSDEARVREELRQRLKAVAKDPSSVHNPGRLEELERLDRLARLLGKHGPVRPDRMRAARRHRGVPIATVMLLNQRQVRSTEITLVADVSYMEFVLAASQPVIGAIPLISLESAGAGVELLPDKAPTSTPVALRVEKAAICLSTWAPAQGHVGIASPWRPPKNIRAQIQDP